MALAHLRNLKTKKAIWPTLLIVLSQLKNISDAISHWQNIQWLWQHVKAVAVQESVQLVMLVVGLVWLAVVALWPQKKLAEPVPAAAPPDNGPLPRRLLALADELKEFLKRLGPEPEIVWRANMSANDFNDANKAVMIRSQKMEAMFYRRFHARVMDIYNEACELGTIHDVELERLLRTRADNDLMVEGVIKRLAAVAADVSVKQA